MNIREMKTKSKISGPRHYLISRPKSVVLCCYWHPFKWMIQRLPVRWTYRLADLLAACFYAAAAKKRNRLIQQLKHLGICDAEPSHVKPIVREAFWVLTCNELEVLLYPVMNPGNIEAFVTCSGLDNLDKALSLGKGAILLFAHFGANQMVMPAIGYRGYRMSQLSAPATVWQDMMPNRAFARMEVLAMKRKWEHELTLPVEHINIFRSIKRAFVCLRKNNVLGVAIDGGWGKDRAGVVFFGRTALFSTGAAELSRRTGCPILPTFMVRQKDGRNQMIIEPPLDLDRPSGQNDTAEAMRQFVKLHEAYVRKHPSHYLNFLDLRHRMAQIGDTPLFPENQEEFQ